MKSPLPILGAGVHPIARGRGAALATEGRVEWRRATSARLDAVVGGRDPAAVSVVRDGRALFASCSCGDPSPTPCEHAWACVAQAWRDRQKILGATPPTLLIRDDKNVARPGSGPPVVATPPPADGAQLGLGRLLHVRPVEGRARASTPLTRAAPAPAPAPSPRTAGARPDPPHYVWSVATGDALEIQILVFPPAPGKPGPASDFKMSWHGMGLYDASPDGDALEAIAGRPTPDANGKYPRFRGLVLRGAARAHALDLTVATGRAYFETRARGVQRLARDDGPPWRFVLRAREDDRGAWQVEGVLKRDGAEARLGDAQAIYPDGTVILGDRLARYEEDGGASWIELLRLHGTHTCAPQHRGAFLEEIYGRPRSPTLELPTGRELARVALAPVARLLVEPRDRQAISARLAFLYGDAVVPAGRPGKTAFDAAGERLIQRDADAEARAIAAAIDAGFSRDARGPADELEIAPRHFAPAVEALLAAGFHVEAAGSVYRQSGAVRLDVSSGTDWFELRGHVEFEGASVDLAAVLEAARRGDACVVLDDGTLGLLPDAWLKRHGLLARLGDRTGDALRFRKAQVGLLDALLAAQPTAGTDPTFRRARSELETFEKIAPEDPGPAFVGTLRGYQREGLGWLRFLERFGFGGCLADEMGLGKTVQVLALLASRERVGPSLVVAPRSLLYNWRNEAARFTPSLRVLEHAGASRLQGFRQIGDHDIVLTTYGTLRRDAEALAGVAFDYVILDEGQAIKNEASDTAKAARLLQARHRLVISGTPIENHLGELWSLFEFMNPGMLGSLAAFREVVAHDAGEGDAPRVSIARAVRPFLLRRTKAAVAPELPPRVDETILCELGAEQRAVYEGLRQHYRASLLERVADQGLGRAKIHVLEALLRLRQAACHPALVDANHAAGGSAKLTALAGMLAPVVEGGHKALVFSQFTRLLALVREELDRDGVAYAYLDGKTTDREAVVARFQSDPACPVFLVSLKAGGVGLNLTAAEYVFLLDPWWNPAVEAQALDRAHRIGQTRTVFTYRLVAKDTVEETILALQHDKRRLAESLFDESSSLLQDLTARDLEALLA